MGQDHVSIRRNHKDLTHRRIIDAAVAMLRESAADLLTMGRVAVRAGVTERTVSRHFSTGDALIRASWRRCKARCSNRYARPCPHLTTMPPGGVPRQCN
ncbi:hypothetical protein WP12_03665 [Sphingomonas sp. SRS2]|nr:hypothetical protein WP12_03665 [Sphingomonas sp. SRS2]